jgi:hypothetical protein
MAGPVAASVLLGVGGPAAAIAFDGLTFLVSALLLGEISTPPDADLTSYGVSPHRAMRSVISCRAVRALLGVEAAWALLGAAPILVLGPVVCATRLDGPVSWAAIVTAYGIGGVLGGFVIRSSATARRHAALGFCSRPRRRCFSRLPLRSGSSRLQLSSAASVRPPRPR